MDDDDEILCVDCDKKESDPRKYVTCLYCFNSAHISCRGLRGNATRRPYYCSTKCSELYKRITEMQQNQESLVTAITSKLSANLNTIVSNAVGVHMNQVRNEMDAVVANAMASQLHNVREEMRTITSAVESSQDFLSNKFDTIASDFKDLKSENDRLKKEMESMKRSHHSLNEVVSNLESHVDKSSKTAVSRNVIVFGLPALPNENVHEIIAKTFTCIGASLPNDADTFSASRLYTSNKQNPNIIVPIRVIFKDNVHKEVVISKKMEYGQLQSATVDTTFSSNGTATYVSIRDELTPLMVELLKEMRELQPILNIKYVWTGRGGVVLVKKDEKSNTEKITNRSDITRIKNLFTKRVQRQNSLTPSPEPERLNNKRKKQ